MRSVFIETLIELAQKDERILLLTADLGYTVMEPFAQRFPKRFFNVGVAEQNMVGMATGLAEAGFIPFLYSINNFASIRPYEFIRNGPILHQLPVRIVGVGSGFDYGSAGITHYGLEDIGLMRLQKGITVVVPADRAQAKTALQKTWDLSGPVYYRIGKGDKNAIAGLDGKFEIGGIQKICDGNDFIFISMGSISREAVSAADQLAQKGIFGAVVVISSFNPSPVNELAGVLRQYPLAVTVEDHYVTGGVGYFVAEVVAENNISCRVVRCGVDTFAPEVTGSRKFMNDLFGISASKLVEVVSRYFSKNLLQARQLDREEEKEASIG